MAELNEIKVVTRNSRDALGPRQLTDYREQRRDCLTWLLQQGKNPEEMEGYAETTVKNRAYRMDRFYRWVWEQEGMYTSDVSHEHADEHMKWLANQEKSNAHKANCMKALKMLFKWRRHRHGLGEWDPVITFSDNYRTTAPRDFLTMEERRKLRDAALEYGSAPSYDSLTPEQRDRWKAHLAQRFGKPKSEVKPEDWDRANGWRTPSLVWTSLDTGLRPVEVARARVDWVDTDNNVIRIPKEQSSKNRNNWRSSIREQTARYLERWIEERRTYPIYDDTDKLWLTVHGNPFRSATLKRLLHKICDIAGISTENRSMTWYSIRHSVGTYMAREEGLAAAQAQLRHKSVETTMKYDQAPVEDRRDALDRMG